MNSVKANPKYTNEKLDKVNVGFFAILPVVTVALTFFYIKYFDVSWGIAIFALVFAAATNLSITAGYHRLFSHRSYQGHPILRMALLLIGASGYQGSALKWSSDHRRHHNKLDTEDDPYSVTEGFWHAHMGWLFYKDENEKIKATDLEADKMVMWQHDNYLLISIVMGFIFPTVIGALLGDPLGGLVFAGCLRIILTQQSTFFVNSLCHMVGKRPYSLQSTARDSFIVAVLTHGEGYHNFHHRFQTDYRNGIRWYHWDPTKWVIKSMALLGLAQGLRKISQQEILKARLQVDELKIKSVGYSDEKIRQLKEQILVAQVRMKTLREEYKRLKSEKNEAWQNKVVEIKRDIATAKMEFKVGMQIWRIYLSQARLAPVRVGR
ncbi:MAG: fatty acid desaturase [Bdellovibrionota bacterium]